MTRSPDSHRQDSHHPAPRLIVALDFPAAAPALALAHCLDPGQCRLKVGLELYVAAGAPLIEALQRKGFEVFLDLKFHDIPHTVAAACRAAAALGVWMINVHASGGRRMLEAAAEGVQGTARPPKLVAVTVLTSQDRDDLAGIGLSMEPVDQVLRLAGLAHHSGLDGVVCSAAEADLVRQACGPGFLLVTPGIRPAGGANQDQRRVMTPSEALKAGADYLVVGRPVTQAGDPAVAVAALIQEMGRG